MMTGARLIPRVSPKAREYVAAVLDHGFHNATSPGFAGRLERQFAAKFDSKFGILHANGTATMHSALLAAGVGAGDEVIVPAYTMASTALVALHANAVPVFADVDPDSWTICADDVRRKLSPRTRAIIPVAIHGLPPDLDPLMELARERGLTVIEDNAQCFLGKYRGRLAGSLGHFASFSFQASKHMTCGDGGILITSDEALALAARRAAVLGYSAISARPGEMTIPESLRCHPSFARHVSLGYNFRLPEIAAAVALAELERLDELVAMRQAVARLFAEVVATCAWLVPQKVPQDCQHSYWSYAVRIAGDGVDWSEFRRMFVELGGDGFYGAWLPVHREPVFAALYEAVEASPERYPQFAGCLPDYRQSLCPVWERLQPRVLHLKTNYFDLDEARRQADLFEQAIRRTG